jgi:3'-phosphoadenosine 5'-phosphosulfate (PAPS) 3'-phosphatase
MEKYVDKYFPGLLIVGEEDTTYQIEYGDKYNFLTEIVDIDLNSVSDTLFEKNEFDLKDLKLFIDPIDATMDFIKKNFAVVTNLVGITYKDEAYCGLVHYPYMDGEENGVSVSYFNLPGKGIYEFHTYENKMSKLEIVQKEKINFSCSSSKITPKLEESILF